VAVVVVVSCATEVATESDEQDTAVNDTQVIKAMANGLWHILMTAVVGMERKDLEYSRLARTRTEALGKAGAVSFGASYADTPGSTSWPIWDR